MEISVQKAENISVCNHPIALHNLTIMRDKNTSSELLEMQPKDWQKYYFSVLRITCLPSKPKLKLLLQKQIQQ